MTDHDMQNMETLFQRYIGALSEDFQGKLDLVVEGHQNLHQEIKELSRKTDERFDLVDLKFDAVQQRMDNLDTKIDTVAADLKATDERLSAKIDGVEEKLTRKIDAVAADLKAHRTDTEAHGSVYQVKEN